MMCYLDQTFCSSDCINTECFRNFSPEKREGAKRWWKDMPGSAPIAFSDFSKGCEEYVRPV